jgi:proline iminopeptidase
MVALRLALLLLALANLPAHAQSPADPSPALRDGPHHAVINGVRLWYRVAGTPSADVPPVIFLHGGPGQGSVAFAELAGPALERTLRMVYLDQRGSGRSERPWTGDYTMATLVEDIEGVRRHLGGSRIVLVGHSFGGTLALEYAAAYPERVAGLVFVAGLWDAPRQGGYRCERMLALHPEEEDDGGACEWFWRLPADRREAAQAALMFPDDAVRVRQDSVEAASGLRNTGELSSALFRAGLPQYRFTAQDRLAMPVLVISGRHDGAAVSRGLRELAELLPAASFIEYEGSGHFVYLDEPERFARDVTAFVAATSD